MRSSSRLALDNAPRLDRPRLAVMCLCSAVALASSIDAIVKFLSGGYPVHQLLAVRAGVALPLLAGFVLWREGSLRVPRAQWKLVTLRCGIMATAYLGFSMAVATLPLASGVAIYFTMPLFVAALAGPVLGEHVPAYRWALIAAGFGGVLIMIRPGSSVFEPSALLALYAAFGYGSSQLITRSLTGQVPSATLAFWGNGFYLLLAFILTSVFSGFGDQAGLHPSIAFLTRSWQTPPLSDFVLMASTGFLSAAAMVLFASAYRLGEANFVAPFEYSAMLWATLFGVFVFAGLPDAYTITGGGVVALAGLIMLWLDSRARSARNEVRSTNSESKATAQETNSS
jgi:drug/metabolite transporter (DMT)-like permease